MSNGIVRTNQATASIEPTNMADLFKLADMLSKASDMVPRAFKGNPHAICAAILTGQELGIRAMESLRSIYIVDGKPTVSAELMLSLVRRGGVKHKWLKSDNSVAHVRLERDGESFELEFTIRDAQNAGLAGKDNWKKYPATMLRARAISAAIRAFCPDAMGANVYTPEEMGANVNESGAVIEAKLVPQSAPLTDAEFKEVKEKFDVLKRTLRLDDCATSEDLLAWCEENRERVSSAAETRKHEASERIRAAAERIGADAFEALEAAGLGVKFDPETGEVEAAQ